MLCNYLVLLAINLVAASWPDGLVPMESEITVLNLILCS